jgi:ferredoxin--NADP+ reductase
MSTACVAVVGSGPAAFYAATILLRSDEPLVHVDVYEKLPTPWGLVRSGVAPDHPKIKNVGATFAKTADHERFRYFGNVEFGRDVSRADLLERYDAVVYAVGAKSDNHLGIPGEDLPGSVAATDFVGWYNAHPDFRDFTVDLDTERVVVIGAGNVALDVARILVTDTEVLAGTDIADHALAALRASKVREVVVVARRGPVQGAFTTIELRELGELDGVDCVLDPAVLEGLDAETMKGAPHTVRTNLEAMRRLVNDHPPTGRPRRLVLRFASSPIEIHSDENGRVTEVVLGGNDLVTAEDGSVKARDNGTRETLPAGVVVRAVGYRGVALPDVVFDERRGIIPNEGGRVTGGEREYVTGWIKRGPSGVIGTNRKDGQQTAEAVLADLAGRPDCDAAHIAGLADWVRSRCPDVVEEVDWRAIDRHETASGEAGGRPRVKLCTVPHMLEVVAKARTSR